MAKDVEREYQIILAVSTKLWRKEIVDIVNEHVQEVLEENGITLESTYVEEE